MSALVVAPKRFLHRVIALLACLLATSAVSHASPAITEFMASNKATLTDEDGDYSDWIEIYNPDDTAASLGGWYLTDNAKKKTKWTLPAVTLAPKAFIVVFASSKDRIDPAKPLHTNFSLDADGEYLALIKPDATTIVSEFGPTFPGQVADISYGVTQPTVASETAQVGYFRTPTPGTANGGASGLILVERVAFSRAPGPFTGTIAISLSGASATQKIRYVIAAPSASGADVPMPTAGATVYTGPITVSASTIVRAAVFSGDDARSGLAASAQYLRLADFGSTRVDTFSSHMPIFVLDDHGLGPLVKDDIDHPAWLYAYEPSAGGSTGFQDAPTLATPITMKVHGFSSADFPKKSYNLDLTDDLGRGVAKPLLGLASFDSWILVGPWLYDRSFIRNAFVYALSNRIGRWAPRTRLAEVFFNRSADGLDASDYAGVYVLTDKIEVAPQRVDIATLAASDTTEPGITGGYILRVDDPHADRYSWHTDHGFPDAVGSDLMVEEPKAAKLPQVQRDYIRTYVQKMENALYADSAVNWATHTYLDYVDRDSWIDHHLLNVLVKNIDALRRSMYFSKDRGGKLVAGPVWDYDRSLGSTDGRDVNWAGWNGEYDSVDYWNFGWWGVLARDPEFMQAWIDRWQSLRRGECSDQSLAVIADELAAQVDPAAAARDAAQWPEDKSPYYDGHAGEVTHLKDWVILRAGWIDAQFVTAPSVGDYNGILTMVPAPGTVMAYTLDGTDPRSIGGTLSATAILTTAPLIIPDTANVHARTYVASTKTFPGSPWSSPVTGPHSSSLLMGPKPRLVNLSVRSNVREGENVLIAAVVVRDAPEKTFLARAVGPTLTDFGVTQALTDPLLCVVSSTGVEISRNCGWQTDANAALLSQLAAAVGAFPLGTTSRDSALAPSLPTGIYSVLVSSATNHTGTALVELYETDNTGRAVNFSARGVVGPSDGPLIGGFVVTGTSAKRILIRAVGPTLSSYGVTHALPDPVLTLYRSQAVIATSDQWGSNDNAAAIATAARDVGAFTLAGTSADAALLLSLDPGVYSIMVTGKGTADGVTLIELYDLD